MRLTLLPLLVFSFATFAAPSRKIDSAKFGAATAEYLAHSLSGKPRTLAAWVETLPLRPAKRQEVLAYLAKKGFTQSPAGFTRWHEGSTVLEFGIPKRVTRVDFALLAGNSSVKVNGKSLSLNRKSSFASIVDQYAALTKSKRHASLDYFSMLMPYADAEESDAERRLREAQEDADYWQKQVDYWDAEVKKADAALVRADERVHAFDPFLAVVGPILLFSGLDQTLACTLGGELGGAGGCVFGSDAYWLDRASQEQSNYLTSYTCDAQGRFSSATMTNKNMYFGGRMERTLSWAYDKSGGGSTITVAQGRKVVCEYRLEYSKLKSAPVTTSDSPVDPCQGRNRLEPMSNTHPLKPGDMPYVVGNFPASLPRLSECCRNELCMKEINEAVARNKQTLAESPAPAPGPPSPTSSDK